MTGHGVVQWVVPPTPNDWRVSWFKIILRTKVLVSREKPVRVKCLPP